MYHFEGRGAHRNRYYDSRDVSHAVVHKQMMEQAAFAYVGMMTGSHYSSATRQRSNKQTHPAPHVSNHLRGIMGDGQVYDEKEESALHRAVLISFPPSFSKYFNRQKGWFSEPRVYFQKFWTHFNDHIILSCAGPSEVTPGTDAKISSTTQGTDFQTDGATT
uniref:Uncharacterized protein n=1 Tax=Solanum tuberosum TaxID=4113 RepID=M1DDT4_SOLTU